MENDNTIATKKRSKQTRTPELPILICLLLFHYPNNQSIKIAKNQILHMEGWDYRWKQPYSQYNHAILLSVGWRLAEISYDMLARFWLACCVTLDSLVERFLRGLDFLDDRSCFCRPSLAGNVDLELGDRIDLTIQELRSQDELIWCEELIRNKISREYNLQVIPPLPKLNMIGTAVGDRFMKSRVELPRQASWSDQRSLFPRHSWKRVELAL